MNNQSTGGKPLCPYCDYIAKGPNRQKLCAVNPSYPTVLEQYFSECGSYVNRTGPMLTISQQVEKRGNKYFGTRGRKGGN